VDVFQYGKEKVEGYFSCPLVWNDNGQNGTGYEIMSVNETYQNEQSADAVGFIIAVWVVGVAVVEVVGTVKVSGGVSKSPVWTMKPPSAPSPICGTRSLGFG